jgi:hypothetical protein
MSRGMRRLTRATALLDGLLVDVSDHACEQGYEVSMFASAAVMHAHGVAGIRALIVLISQVAELADEAPALERHLFKVASSSSASRTTSSPSPPHD